MIASRNKSEALTRAVCFHRFGEIRDRSYEFSATAPGLSLVVAAIILWNTVHLEKAINTLRTEGENIPDDLFALLSPSCQRRSKREPLGQSFKGVILCQFPLIRTHWPNRAFRWT